MVEDISLDMLLRQARESRGESLEQVRQQIGTSIQILEELESGRFQTIEPVYARLAAANYGEYLGIEPREITARFDAEFGRPDISSDRVPAPGTGVIKQSSDWYHSLATHLREVPPARFTVLTLGVIALGVVLAFLDSQPEMIPPKNSQIAAPIAPQEPPPVVVIAAPTADSETSVPVAETPTATELSTYSPSTSEEVTTPETMTNVITSAVKPAIVEQAPEQAEPKIGQEETKPSLKPATDTQLKKTAVADGLESRPAPEVAESVLVLRAVAKYSTWVRIQWDSSGGTEEIIPSGESRQWEASDHFQVRAGRARWARFYFQDRLLGDGRLGNPNEVLRFHASSNGVFLLGPDLKPLSRVDLAPDATTEGGTLGP